MSWRAAAIGSIDFNQNLVQAKIIAAAYGMEYSPDIGRAVPSISLVGRNAAPLRKAFEEFSYWAEFSDADAVDVTLVFEKSGGYKFIISPNPEMLIKRLLEYDSISDRLAIQLSWIKPIDSTSEALKDLRSHLEKGIRPYILSAATYSGISLGSSPTPELIRSIPGIKQLLKFRIRFVDEGSESDKQWQGLASGEKKPRLQRDRTPLYVPSPRQIMKSRINRLKVLFPVTLWRGENTELLSATFTAARAAGLADWQIRQAFCNAVLSREITKGWPHFTGIKKKEWPDLLFSKLRERYEIADGRMELVPLISPDELVHQSVLDSGYLLKQLGLRKIPSTFDGIQNELSGRGFLEVQVLS